MNDLFTYLLKVSGGLVIITAPYYLVLRNDPNLVLKRYYLLLGLLASWLFPLVSFSRPDLLPGLTPVFYVDPLVALPRLTGARIPDDLPLQLNWLQVTLFIYLAGVLSMFIRNLVVLSRWNRAWKTAERSGGVAYTSNNHIFTLFNRIFIPGAFRGKSDLENVLLHEKAHLHQFHFVDLTMMELTLLLTWFNPFSWLISRMIKENHEHLADRKVLTSGVSPARYRAQLLNQVLGVPVFRLGNPFNHSITFKRFNMMKKPLKSNAGIVKFLVMVPLVLVTLAMTTGTSRNQEQVKGRVLFADTGDPAQGAAVVVAGTREGTVTGPDGTFQLDVEGNPELVISFIGYNTLRIKASEATRKDLRLEPGVFELDPGDMPEPKNTTAGGGPVDKPESGSSQDGEIFYVVEELPMFPG
ncbi:MAG: hypothetical protein EHM46_06005, partial [Bacteroidetes bacterium]